MKYVMFSDDNFVIFSEGISHDKAINRNDIVSAGFCKFETRKNEYDEIRYNVFCYGKSDTLNMISRKEDSEIMSCLMR